MPTALHLIPNQHHCKAANHILHIFWVIVPRQKIIGRELASAHHPQGIEDDDEATSNQRIIFYYDVTFPHDVHKF